MANFPHRQDSSSSDDDRGSVASAAITELHDTSDCRYHRYMAEIDGRVVYVWLRNCVCGHYSSVTMDTVDGAVSGGAIGTASGRDVHFSAECRWRRRQTDGRNELRLKCVCGNHGNLRTASFTGNVNYFH